MQKNALPEIVQKSEKLIQKCDGTTVAVIELCYFELSGDDRVTKRLNGFFTRITNKFKKWVDKDFSSYAADTFVCDANPRKRFRYAPYLLKYSLEAQIGENDTLFFRADALLQKNGSVLAEKRLCGGYRLKNGKLQNISRSLKNPKFA